MAYTENIEQTYKITTGEGSTFQVLWKNAEKSYEFNIAQFEFIETPGTKVDRREVKGRTFPLEIYFVGDDHLTNSSSFEIATLDKRPWTIEHPLYGKLIVQPISLSFNNSESISYTKITGSVMETITDAGLVIQDNPIDIIEELNTESLDAGAETFSTVTPNPSDMAQNADVLYQQGKSITTTQLIAEEYFNLFNETQAVILNATAEPLAAIRLLQTMTEAPARFETSVQNRITALTNQFSSLLTSILNIIPGNVTLAQKLLFENSAGPLINSLALAASLPLTGDYQNRSAVLSVINTLVTNYNSYVSAIDGLRSGVPGNPNTYSPGSTYQNGLSSLINFTISNLFVIASGARQERNFILTDDDNLITLSHRFYGPSLDDANVTEFRLINNIGLSEILGLKKGRSIIYYV
jgi:hypothetical protein